VDFKTCSKCKEYIYEDDMTTKLKNGSYSKKCYNCTGRIGKEFKQSTCRYVKECKRGWTRNDKFICRKTTRRLSSPEEPIRKFTSKTSRKSSKSREQNENENENEPVLREPRPALSRISEQYDNEPYSPALSRISEQNENEPEPVRPVKKFTSKGKPKSKTAKTLGIGNTFMYTHPDGRKEKVTVTGIGPNKQLEVHIPSLANKLASKPKLKKNQKVFYIYSSGTKEQGIIKKVYDLSSKDNSYLFSII
jgi:hypothetical protein